MKIRTVAAVGVVALSAATLTLAGCSDSKKDSSSTSSSTVSGGGIGGNVTAPVILNPNNTSATVKVGQVVTFDMGQPASGGSFVATSNNTKVFEVTSEGKSVGTSTQNAGGKAVGTGKAEVIVQFKGSMNGMGSPTTFTITVQ